MVIHGSFGVFSKARRLWSCVSLHIRSLSSLIFCYSECGCYCGNFLIQSWLCSRTKLFSRSLHVKVSHTQFEFYSSTPSVINVYCRFNLFSQATRSYEERHSIGLQWPISRNPDSWHESWANPRFCETSYNKSACFSNQIWLIPKR